MRELRGNIIMPRSFVYLLNSVDFEELGGSYAILGSIAFWGGCE